MEEELVSQFFRDVESWKPDATTANRLRETLKKGQTPPSHVEPLAEGLVRAGLVSYRFLEAVHALASAPSVDRKAFVSNLAQMVEAVTALKEGHAAYRKAFAAYHDEVQGRLVRARFDTLYYDAIQNFDVKSALKDILKDVDLLLRSFSLVSAEMAGVKCLELYEDCVRFHLYAHYLEMRKPSALEECWSVLFDLNGLFTSEGESDPDEELEEFKEDLEAARRKET